MVSDIDQKASLTALFIPDYGIVSSCYEVRTWLVLRIDRLMLVSGQFSLADCLFDYKKAIKLHGDDVLAHSNWELAEWWLRKYSSGQHPPHSSRLLTFLDNRYLIENSTLSICNRWRRERGESELTMSDIGAQGDSPAS